MSLLIRVVAGGLLLFFGTVGALTYMVWRVADRLLVEEDRQSEDRQDRE